MSRENDIIALKELKNHLLEADALADLANEEWEKARKLKAERENTKFVFKPLPTDNYKRTKADFVAKWKNFFMKTGKFKAVFLGLYSLAMLGFAVMLFLAAFKNDGSSLLKGIHQWNEVPVNILTCAMFAAFPVVGAVIPWASIISSDQRLYFLKNWGIALGITGVLFALNVKGAMLIGILATTLIGIPMGITEFKGVVSMPESIEPIFCKFEWDKIFTLDMLVIVFTFLFIDMFDTVGTLIGVSTKAKMVDEKGNIPHLKQAFMADAIATTAGAVLGTSTTTTYVESASGVAQGGRTGLTAFTIAVCFAVALFFSPLFLSVPGAATAPVLILVGMLMMEPVRNIDFDDATEAIPSFICLVMMPLAYSISAGILLGMIAYVVINVCCGKFKKITPTMYILAILFILKYIFI